MKVNVRAMNSQNAVYHIRDRANIMKKTIIAALLCSGLVANPATAKPDYSDSIKADYDKSLGALWDHFHRNPELSFRETKTAARMAQELRAIPGIEVTENVGGTGVVGVMKNGNGPIVLVRADMDALPVQERSGLANASTVRQVGVDGLEMPVMHACGHDVHITSMVGAARQLAAMKNRWKGTVLFIVQPAEERVGGAAAMIKDGLYTRFPKPNYALAFHVSAELETGKISASEGLQYSSADSVDIRVQGIATHGASPQLGKDPVYIASQIVMGLQGIIAREKGPLEPGVITVGAFHGGQKHNIISEFADLQVTVRSNDQAVRNKLIAAIERVAKGIAQANGVPDDKLPIVKVIESTPVTVNDGVLARRLNGVLANVLGKDAVVPFKQTGMGGEDFAYFIDPSFNIPGYYFAVGGTNPAWKEAAKNGGPAIAGHHSPLFKIDPEPSVRLGVEAMTAAVLDLLKK
jgi:amidohydrolase